MKKGSFQAIELRALMATSVLALLSACGGSDSPEPAVLSTIVKAPAVAQTEGGDVKAVDRLGMRSYFAIPFAAPPVGDLRWAPPAAPQKWTAARERTASAAPCLQTSASPFRLSGDSEDCLYLDVHAPTGDGPFPVMVWIHGGAFNTGGAVTYADPSPLVSKGVVVVNIAYRLGAMSFLAHPSLVQNGSAGNYGIMDQQAALKWVQNNIANFAGDKNNVTIFGESAGGFSVMTHLAAPASKGLFQKAIVQSGNYANDRQPTATQMEATSATVVNNAITAATTAGVTGINCPTGTVTAACLRSLPEAVLRTYLANAFNTALSSPVPSVDGKVLPKSVKATFLAGENNKVPVINGSNQDEYSLFLAISEIGRRAAATPPNFDPANATFALQPSAYAATLAGLAGGTGVSAADLATIHYPLANYGDNVAQQPSLGATAAATDNIFACPALRVSQRIATQNSPIWMYEFRDQTAIPSVGIAASNNYYVSFPQGAGHSYEIQYLFNLRDLGNDERRQLQTAMSRYWTNFARTGDPNKGTEPQVAWPTFSAPDRILGLDVASGGGIKQLATFEADHKCASVWSMLTF